MFVIGEDVLARINNQRAEACMYAGDFSNALLYLDVAIQQNPRDACAHWNRAMCLLSLGRYPEGFAEFENRWDFSNWLWALQKPNTKRIKPWAPGEIYGKRLLLVHDGGRGDNIMMLRYVPRLRDLGSKVTILTVPELRRLAEQFDVEVITEAPADLSRFDQQLAMFSIMAALNETTETIPPPPYLRATPRANGCRIGLCWSGVSQTQFTQEQLLDKLGLEGPQVQALQPGPTTYGVHPLPEGGDFLDVAELALGLDHVVTVDTACANLMGAIGHPSTHLLLRTIMDFRWYYASSWYPTIRTYRQRAVHNWAEVFAQVRNAIAAVPA
jgi:hypothetical protein